MYENFLRTPDAARLLGLGKSTLEKLRVFGGGPAYRQLGRAVIYDPADLKAWAEAHPLRHSTSQAN